MTNNDWGKSTWVCTQNLSAPRAVHWIKLTKNNYNVIKYNMTYWRHCLVLQNSPALLSASTQWRFVEAFHWQSWCRIVQIHFSKRLSSKSAIKQKLGHFPSFLLHIMLARLCKHPHCSLYERLLSDKQCHDINSIL